MSFNPITLKGKRFLVSGAASGIGRASSILISKLGAELILADIDAAGLNQTLNMCETAAHTLIIDLRKTDEIKNKLMEVTNQYGKLNGFVHCAGIPYISPLKSISVTKTTDVFLLNTYAAVELAKVFINPSVSSGNKDSIVLISSVYGNVGSAANIGYSLSKSALHGLTRSLAVELAPRNIRVNCIAPGFVKTTMLDSLTIGSDPIDYDTTIANLHPLGLGSPEDIANMIAFLLSDMSTWVTGSILNVDGGFTAQ